MAVVKMIYAVTYAANRQAVFPAVIENFPEMIDMVRQAFRPLQGHPKRFGLESLAVLWIPTQHLDNLAAVGLSALGTGDTMEAAISAAASTDTYTRLNDSGLPLATMAK